MQNLEIKQMIEDAGMVADPNFYLGRNANLVDLNGTIINEIYEILQTQNEQIAYNFVIMVFNIEDLKATNFLQALFFLLGHDSDDFYFQYEDYNKKIVNSIAFRFNEILTENFDDTNKIKRQFWQLLSSEDKGWILRQINSNDMQRILNSDKALEKTKFETTDCIEAPVNFVNYITIKSILEHSYKKVIKNNCIYFFNENNLVVATESNDILNLYFACDEEIIFSHYDTVVMGIVKNFKLKTKDKQQIADVMAISGLKGAHVKFKQEKNQFIELESDSYLLIEDYYSEGDYDDLIDLMGFKEMFMSKDIFKIGTISNVNKKKNTLKFQLGNFIINVNSKLIYDIYKFNYIILKKYNERKMDNKDNYIYEKMKREILPYYQGDNPHSIHIRENLEQLQSQNYNLLGKSKVAILERKIK